ncbi:hypothetical protein BAU08_09370 [Bordetella bronchialis]|uniref:Uncharacterized protein n=1 Tax=Bordetella bronchialis TaxID=463025 RepID=A0A193FWF4_9BORD|nr:hypothetical protein BAU08_09370 [Bordetella bronchialis]
MRSRSVVEGGHLQKLGQQRQQLPAKIDGAANSSRCLSVSIAGSHMVVHVAPHLGIHDLRLTRVEPIPMLIPDDIRLAFSVHDDALWVLTV